MQTAFHASTEHVLVQLLLQISVILIIARAVGMLFVRFGQSQSIGEIAAGVMMGPSLLGWIAPGLFSTLFVPHGPPILPFLSHIALILTLFLIGMEFDYGEIPKHGKQVAALALSTLISPLLAGVGLAYFLWGLLPGQKGFLAYALFIGITLAITAIPIMGRILMEQSLTQTRMGVIAITTGATKDLFTWFLLTLIIGIARPPVDLLKFGKMVGLTALLGLVVLTLGRRLLRWAEARYGYVHGKPHPTLLSGLLIALSLCAAATSYIGIFAIFGAFLAGVAVSGQRRLAEAVADRIHDLTILYFLPLFFTYTGLRADLSLLGRELVLACGAATLIGSLAIGGPAYLVSRGFGMTPRESGGVALLINTPGLMVLILLNIGLDLGVIPSGLFSLLVGAAMIKNLVTAPLLRRLSSGGLPAMSAFAGPLTLPREVLPASSEALAPPAHGA
ncbi:MAG TPA: cation:proton antiporter [Pseudomonadota bacterium]|nr:cation:proton antiporter [Pseudomonadota bacterium]